MSSSTTLISTRNLSGNPEATLKSLAEDVSEIGYPDAG